MREKYYSAHAKIVQETLVSQLGVSTFHWNGEEYL